MFFLVEGERLRFELGQFGLHRGFFLLQRE